MKRTDFNENAPGRVLESSTGYFSYVPNPLPPTTEWTNQLLSQLASAERSLARLEEVGRSFPVPHVVVRPFVRKEAILSSKIEGTQTTIQELLKHEARQLNLFGKKQDMREVQNYIEALNFGMERIETLPISNRLIREIHSVLMDGVRGGLMTPGEFRRSQNWIGRPGATLTNARYVPPLVDAMLECLSDLEKYIHDESDIPPLIKISFIHYQFEAIHPFLDGNGRIGRLLITLLLTAWNQLSQPLLYLSNYFEKNRTEYYDRLLFVSQKGKWDEWILFFLDGVNEQAEDAAEKIRALQDLRDNYKARFSKDRNRNKLIDLVDYFIGTPICTISQTQETTKLGTFVTIQKHFDKLVGLGIIEEITGNSRNRVYMASEIMDVLEK